MTEDERRALGQTRRLVFQNLANGVPAPQIREALKLSELEVDQARRFVAKRIAEFRFLKKQPPIPCDDVRSIRFNRKALLGVLARLDDLFLSTEILIRPHANGDRTRFTLKLSTQALDHPEMIEGAKHRMDERR